MQQKIRHRWVITFTFCWSWLVIALGAFTRLTNSGLSCPDWPGCYGRLYVGSLGSIVSHLHVWAEMTHRYAVSVLVLGILLTFVVLLLNRHLVKPLQWLFAGILFLLLVYQPLLGMWTVTLKLHPSIVSQHLLSGMSLMVLIGLQWLYFSRSALSSNGLSPKQLSIFAALGVVLIVLLYCQLALGAWTSTNYAALSCDAFPFCHVKHWSYQFKEAFNFVRPLGQDYSGGVISDNARRTIQVVHRFGALVVGVCIFCWAIALASMAKSLRLLSWAFVAVILLMLQVALGISIVYFSRPLWIALFHTLTASALLMAVVVLNYQLWSGKRGRVDV